MTAHPFGSYPRDLVRVTPRPGAARRLARAQRLASMTPIAAQIFEARDDRARAALVLRLSDDLIHEHFDELKAACMEARFAAGTHYVSLRLAAQLAVRDDAGRMPAGTTAELELWRRGLASIAQVPS